MEPVETVEMKTPLQNVRWAELLPHQVAQYLADRAKEGLVLLWVDRDQARGRAYVVHVDTVPPMVELVGEVLAAVRALTKVLEVNGGGAAPPGRAPAPAPQLGAKPGAPRSG